MEIPGLIFIQSNFSLLKFLLFPK